MDLIRAEVAKMAATIRSYVPGYILALEPVYDNGLVILSIKVQGLGDYLPKYAGNLDIINSAAIAIAEEFAKNRQLKRYHHEK